ncbi:cysteine-rich protein 2-binding protein isoform X2 [Tribolium madens]|uniref:cysteine-rich protein 2-binding protein isoform X2 n=1 Tax=Tribolium madens TaxID=41895 RepID=UPI001CF7477C|nr:cysteine-rich protein 2-binding protein isoform X2 [Tribolium madens]
MLFCKMSEIEYKICKYCTNKLEDCLDEGLTCSLCSQSVHLRCLKNGSVPGGLHGDIFFTFTCEECSETGTESFVREKMSWLKVLVLALYHLQSRSPGLGRKGYFHWRNHIASLIDKNWEILFLRDFKKKKKWVGTVAGTLSHFSTYFFKSGTSVVNEPAWWALTYPKLTPNVISNLYSALTNEKQKSKILKISISDAELFTQILHKNIKNDDLLTPLFTVDVPELEKNPDDETKKISKNFTVNKRKSLLPTFESTSKKLLKLNKNAPVFSNLGDELTPTYVKQNLSEVQQRKPPSEPNKESVKLLDPFCHYNTCFSNASRPKGTQMKVRLMGGIRKELILSPYSSIYLKPYIRRDTETYPSWIRLMAEIQMKANEKTEGYVLPPRAPIDYTYVQPEHIPAINSLCNNFFWSGIDLTECLQYPDFSCVVLYRKLIVGFAFLVPNVKYTENYISFIFTRPGWRNVGIGKFMLYHLIQTSLGKDITLHVSINNPALFLYQKFGFKVEAVVLNFYDKYIRETSESKHAFFCRLER